jgi:hypothetical protein
MRGLMYVYVYVCGWGGWQDLEDLTVSSRRKQGAEASAAFVKAKAHLEALVKEL